MKNSSILKKITLTILAIVFPCFIFCQPTKSGSLAYLQSCNGFMQIKLGSCISLLENAKLTCLDGVDSLDSDSCYKFCYRDVGMLDLGNGLFLNLVGLRTYKDEIINIYLFFKRDDGYAILKDFEANYGKCTNAPGEFMYDWKTNGGVTLFLRYKQSIEMGVAIFTCDNVQKQLVEDSIKRKAAQKQAKDLLGSL